MRSKHRDVGLAQRSGETEVSLYGIDVDELLEGVTQFKFMGIPLDQSDDYWTAILQNIRRSQKVWVRLEKILQQKGADTHVSEMFYQVVV